ncbi:hypothetical protein CWI36_0479p0030 [Hamiltosporidium magnivora]|uniref:Uncharacterized protein n=1 Tax=Hamiltosporidium magnivora TaxID=148818 RepID=A0A4Q9LEA1_9MICR|nr:hypothetical protein CWI36_0479p0030 [Hamiltosporidium magnivora]
MFSIFKFCCSIWCLNDLMPEKEDYNMILPIYLEHNALTYVNTFRNYFPTLAIETIERNFGEIFNFDHSEAMVSNVDYIFPILHFCKLFLNISADIESFYCNTMLLLIRMKYIEYFDKLKNSHTNDKKYFQVSLNFAWNLQIIVNTLYDFLNTEEERIKVMFFLTNEKMKILDKKTESFLDSSYFKFNFNFHDLVLKCRCNPFSVKWQEFFEGNREDIFFRILSLFFLSLYENTTSFIFDDNNFDRVKNCSVIIGDVFFTRKINEETDYCMAKVNIVFDASINKMGELMQKNSLLSGQESFNKIFMACAQECLPTSSTVTYTYDKAEIIWHIRNLIELYKIYDINSDDFEKIAKICNIIYILSYDFYSDTKYIQLWNFCLYKLSYLKEVLIETDFKHVDFDLSKKIVALCFEYHFSIQFQQFRSKLNKIRIFEYSDEFNQPILYVRSGYQPVFDSKLTLFFNHFSENIFFVKFLVPTDLYHYIFHNNLNLNVSIINLLHCSMSIQNETPFLSAFTKEYLKFKKIVNCYENK